MSAPDVLSALAAVLPRTPLDACFAAAEEELAGSWGGFSPEAVGRRAWQLLPEGEREAAFGDLLYAYWEAREHDLEERARLEADPKVHCGRTRPHAAHGGGDESYPCPGTPEGEVAP